MHISKKTLGTILIGLASIIGVASIFCFFGAAEKAVVTIGPISEMVTGPTMFTAMFGGTYQGLPIDLQPGMLALFIIEILIILLALTLIIGNLTKKLKTKASICLTSMIALLTLTAVIMSFCTVQLCGDGDFGGSIEGFFSASVKLGAGPISYSVLGIIGIIANVIGVIVYAKAE